MANDKRDDRVVIRVTKEEKKALALAAKDDARSVSSYMLALALPILREKGYLT